MNATPMRRFQASIILTAALTANTVSAAPPSAPSDLRTNDIVTPVGTGDEIYLGWLVNDPDPNEIQSAYQVLVASSRSKLDTDQGDIWDSGKVSERLQNHIRIPPGKVTSGQRYFWKVRTWDKDDTPGPFASASTFSVGLLHNEDWSGAHWIRRDSSDPDDYTYYRKKINLPERSIERATAYISGTHKFVLHINGAIIGKGPAFHHPQYQYYNAFDVTPHLKSGKDNQLAVFNHWFGGGQGRPAGERGIILKIIIHHTDGSRTEFGTDGSWKQTKATAWLDGQAQRNAGEGVGYIEAIDANLLTPDWASLPFDDSSWKPATVIGPHPTAPWTKTLTADLTRIDEYAITPAAITAQGEGRYLIDLGKVYSGIPRIRFTGGVKGTVIEMRGGFGLDESGEIDPKFNQSTDLSYRAVLNGGTFTYEPVEYLGFRYFQIENSPMPITRSNFTFIVRHAKLDAEASSFDSSNETLNTVWNFMKHSIFTCAQEEFVDTPTREKGGFLGDCAIQSRVAMPVLGERPLTRRALQQFLQSMEQHWSAPSDRGRMNAVYPNRDGARDIPDFTQAYLPWVWSYYMETGDRSFLMESYPRLKQIAAFVKRHEDPKTGLVTDLTGGSNAYLHGIVDWPATMRYGYDMTTAARTVINGWAYADYITIAKIANTLGNHADRDNYRSYARSLKDSINAHLLNDSGVYIDGLSSDGVPSTHVSQHANMFPLALGIVPEEHRETVIAKVMELRMKVGMVTLPWLIDAIGTAPAGPHLIDLFTNPEWHGWARCLRRGATATWESWDADTTGQSQSHAWGAAGLEGYVRYILGIRPLKPQYEELLIQPLDFGEKLTWASGSITTDRGKIQVDWKRTAGRYELRLALPVNVTATVALPKELVRHPKIELNGSLVQGTVSGESVTISGIGSGKHNLVLLPQDG